MENHGKWFEMNKKRKSYPQILYKIVDNYDFMQFYSSSGGMEEEKCFRFLRVACALRNVVMETRRRMRRTKRL